jgi:hypothetical protein
MRHERMGKCSVQAHDPLYDPNKVLAEVVG